MNNYNFVIRESNESKLIFPDADSNYLELELILENEYPYIADAINDENYYIEAGIASFFDEIIYENKVVGFATFDMVSDYEVLLLDCFILPEFRGNRLFFNELEKLIYCGANVSILQPTRNVVELLLDYAFAKKIDDNIVVSAIDFYFDEIDVKSSKNDSSIDYELSSSNFYDLSICSTVLFQDGEIFYHELLENDLVNYGERKKLTFDYFKKIKDLFAQNKNEFNQLAIDLKEELPKTDLDYEDIIGHGEGLSDYMLTFVDDGLISYERALEIKKRLKSEWES